MEFPTASIEEAIGNLSSSDPLTQSLANKLICEWTSSPSFPLSCLLLIQTTSKPQVRQMALITFSSIIIDQWNTLSSEIQAVIRSYFIMQIMGDNLPMVLRNSFNRIIAIIALYDFPQKWDSFLVDLLFVEPTSPIFLKSMLVVAQYIKEIEGCTFLTSDRLLQLEFLLLSFLDLLLPIVFGLLTEPSTSSVGLTIISGLIQWGNITEVLTPQIYSAMLGKCLSDKETYRQTIECLSYGFFDRNDVAPIFEKIAPPLIHAISALPDFQPEVIGFITKFLKKYVNLLELYCFAPVVPDSAQTIQILKATIFRTKMGTTSLELTDLQTKCIPEVRRLFEITILQPPEESYVDDFWPLWRDLSKRLFLAIRGDTMQNSSLLLIQPLLPIIFMKLTEFLPTCIESGRVVNMDAQMFFDIFIRTFPSETIMFITTAPLTPELVYLVGLLKEKDPKTPEYFNMFASRLMENEIPPTFWEPILFTFSRMSSILSADYFERLMQICSTCLSTNDESYQISAAQAIYVAYTIVPHRVNTMQLTNNISVFASSLSDGAMVRMMKLCTHIASKSNIPLEPLSAIIANVLPSRSETAIKAMSEMAIAAAEKCCLLFTPLWSLLFELLESCNGLEELVFRTLSVAIANCRLEDIAEPFETFMTLVLSHPEWSPLTFDLFAAVRPKRPEFDVYTDQLLSLVKQSELSAGLFRMFSAMSLVNLDLNLVISRTLMGIEDITPDIHKEALNTARSVMFSIAENPTLAHLLPTLRPVLMKAVVQSMMDARHMLGFSRQTAFVNEVYILGAMEGDNQYSKEFLIALVASAIEPQPGLFQQVAAHLDHVKESKIDFKESLRDFLLVMRKATPYQLGTFFAEEGGEDSEKETLLLLDEERDYVNEIVATVPQK